ncbi:MAG TPA: M23 family metallopeptidase [Gemmatimonadales bacterium]|nr:M23 family metallopeptidase [Gemmatimonadales bacterium]
MPKTRWTFAWVPHGSGTTRTVTVSSWLLRTVLGTGAVLGIGLLGFATAAVTRAIDITRLERLERVNLLLTQELVRTRALLDNVSDTIATIMVRDQQVRLLAGLEARDPGVQQAGIGGPSGELSANDQLLAADIDGRTALQLRNDVEALTRRANLLARSFQEAHDSLQVHVHRLAQTPSISPTSGWLTSRFAQARMHPIYHQARPHEGIDISAPIGTPIVAPAGGLVIEVQLDEPGYGRTVRIDHGYGVVTRYAHCSKILVRIGQRVKRGDEIALVGNTGISTSPHLHYEVEVWGRTVDPRKYIFPETIVD